MFIPVKRLMAIKVRKKIFLKEMPDDISKKFAKDIKLDIGDEIIQEILSGKSPVKGKRFKKYSQAYAKKKGREAPVDLLESGEMLESIKVVQDSMGRVEISFSDEKAEIHNKGKGKMPARRLLPSKKGEVFKPSLMKKIYKILEKAVKKAVKKQN